MLDLHKKENDIASRQCVSRKPKGFGMGKQCDKFEGHTDEHECDEGGPRYLWVNTVNDNNPED